MIFLTGMKYLIFNSRHSERWQRTQTQLSTVIGLDRNAVNYQLKKLKKIINIERSGSDKKGSWKISSK